MHYGEWVYWRAEGRGKKKAKKKAKAVEETLER